MKGRQEYSRLKVVNAAAYLIMIAVNALANLLPLNGLNTGQVSDQYPNLFTPAAYTFSIWGLIYLLLLGFVLYQFGVFGGDAALQNEMVGLIGPWFIVSSLANSAWVFSWHYRLIGLSVVLMLILLVSLILIVTRINKYGPLPLREMVLVQIPFSIYFGWITVATIANITVLLVSLGWNGFGLPPQTWTVIALFLGLIIAAETMLRNSDAAYGLAVLWAYVGILVRHLSPSGFAGKYSLITTTAIVSIAFLAAETLYLVILNKKARVVPYNKKEMPAENEKRKR